MMDLEKLTGYMAKDAYFIAVSNQKGGVAKTTTAVSLGAALAKQEYRVLLVDLDAQSNLTLSLGFDPRKIGPSVLNVIMNVSRPEEIIRETQIPNLDLAPSSIEMEMAERYLAIRKQSHQVLAEQFRNRLGYNFVIFDCPPALGATTMNAYYAADMLIIPTQAEYFSITALRNMLPIINQVRSRGNPDLVYRILLTMFDRRTRIHRILRRQLKETFHEGLFDNVIDVDTKLRESSAAGEPIHDYYAASRSARQYQALAEEVIQHVERLVPELIG